MIKIILIAAAALMAGLIIWRTLRAHENRGMDRKEKIRILDGHLRELTKTIGERSTERPENMEKAAAYIESVYEKAGMRHRRESYTWRGMKVHNIVAETGNGKPGRVYLVGAHYDTVAGSVGADDNASAVAVQLLTAVLLNSEMKRRDPDLTVKFVSFTLEEPPAYGTGEMGSMVYAAKARKSGERIDGMICLEMVGFTSREKGSQDYPPELRHMHYPKTGDFIAVIGDSDSLPFTDELYAAFRKNRRLPSIRLDVPQKGNLIPQIRLSDHASFWDAGYKAVMVTDTAFFRNPNYHAGTDTMESLDLEFMAEVVESLMIFFRNGK